MAVSEESRSGSDGGQNPVYGVAGHRCRSVLPVSRQNFPGTFHVPAPPLARFRPRPRRDERSVSKVQRPSRLPGKTPKNSRLSPGCGAGALGNSVPVTFRSISKGAPALTSSPHSHTRSNAPRGSARAAAAPGAPSSGTNWKHAAHLLAAIRKERRRGRVNKSKVSQGHSGIDEDSRRCSPFVPLPATHTRGSAPLRTPERCP